MIPFIIGGVIVWVAVVGFTLLFFSKAKHQMPWWEETLYDIESLPEL